MTKLIKSVVIFSLVLISHISFAANFPAPPNPFHYLNDYTNTLTNSEKQQLEDKLVAYGQETSSQIAVVLVDSTQEYEIAQYTFELGDKWGIGRKQLNNGVLMLIAVSDRKIFIATGQGLEGILPDAFLSQVIRNVITPQFKQGRYAHGISNGLDYIVAASKGEFDPHQQQQEDDGWERYIPLLMLSIFVLIVIFGEVRFRTPYISPTNNHNGSIIRQSTLSRPRRGNGNGFGSGGFGGSGGGFGGGGFGGGGAGGSW